MTNTPFRQCRRVSCGLRARILTIFAFAVAAVQSDCTRDIAGSQPHIEEKADISMLTPEIARSLTPDGKFTSTLPSTVAEDELSEGEVRAIARAWIKQGFPWVQSRLEDQHGAEIDRSKLQVCPRIYYGESPYESLPAPTSAQVIRRAFGPWWIVPLCVANEAQVALGIAAYSGVHLENGQIRLSQHPGTEFVWRGVRAGSEVPIAPEAAANLAARLTGTKVASIPRLILPDFRNGSPIAARWAMNVAPTGNGGANGASSQQSTLYVGPPAPGPLHLVSIQRPAEYQPSEVALRIPSAGRSSSQAQDVTLTRKPTIPLNFQPAEVSSHE
jgi:hypothetical protein